MSDVLHWSQRYIAAGWHIFPVHHADKRPAVLRWSEYSERFPTQTELYIWFCNFDYGLAIITGKPSGLFVLDCDTSDAVSDVCARGIPAGTPSVVTSKGRHFLFTMPDFEVTNRAKFLPGCDIRGTGGYVVAPPSVHPSGNIYHWYDKPWLPKRAPGWLLDLLKPPPRLERQQRPRPDLNPRGKSYGRAAFVAEYAVLCTAVEGQRNDQLNRSAFNLGQLIAADLLDHNEVFDALIRAALYLGLPEREAVATITSGLAAGITKPRINRKEATV